ncbi:MAG: DUF3237 domain-containing protein [Deltaproteobacteria bacterium]|nr:DUF3237 domain-containing protein [Deltaproteobacteria bacterium]
MSSIETTHLFDVEFKLGDINAVGNTPYGNRVIGNLAGGAFEGPRLRGTVLPSGGDWGLFRPDGTLGVDGRCCLETDDGALIYAIYGGRWKISPDLLVRLGDPAQIESVDPSEYYLRIHFEFEAAAQEYDWINHIIAIGTGRRTAEGITYRVYAID